MRGEKGARPGKTIYGGVSPLIRRSRATFSHKGRRTSAPDLLPLWEKVARNAPDEG
jgi:hypothetical protein